MSTIIAPRRVRRPALSKHASAPILDRPGDMASALALLAFGANMASPLFPGYQQQLGFGDLTLTLIYATYAAAAVPALLVLGPLGDRLGRTRLVRCGLLLAAAGSLCFAVGAHPAWLLAGRVLQGVALGAATGAGMAVLAQARMTTRRRRLAAAGALVFLLGTAAGPGVTGLLAAVLPAPYASVHLLHVLALAVVFLRLGPSAAPASAAATATAPTARRTPVVSVDLPRTGRPAFVAAMAAGFVSWAVVGLFLGLIPSALTRGGSGAGVAVLGLVAAVVVVAALPAQAVLSRLGAVRAQLAGLGCLVTGLLVLLGAGPSASVVVTLSAAVVAGLGHGLAYGGAHGVVQGAAVGERAAGITATAYVVHYLGAGIPTIVVGLLTLVTSLGAATTGLAASLTALGIAAAVLVRWAAGAAPRPPRVTTHHPPAVHETP
ncbi:MFS transporter [Pseudonocardia phyllosphaerae]|uniref:MFS transporter n=1 Tax=Pseudonocardia phyllosphaerae TaxID=3390502 RepID=UPI0039784067